VQRAHNPKPPFTAVRVLPYYDCLQLKVCLYCKRHGLTLKRDCSRPLVFPRSFAHYGTMRSKMVRARVMLSAMTDATRGEGLEMSGSRARRTAAIVDAATTSVEANRSCLLRSAFFQRWLGASRPSVDSPFSPVPLPFPPIAGSH
jgi:hypothetical protein